MPFRGETSGGVTVKSPAVVSAAESVVRNTTVVVDCVVAIFLQWPYYSSSFCMIILKSFYFEHSRLEKLAYNSDTACK